MDIRDDELKKGALTKSRRAETETRLDELALSPDFKSPLQEKSILSDVPPAKPTTADNLALCARVEAARKTAAVSRSSEILLRAADIQTVAEMDLHEARSARYGAIQTQWPETGFERIIQRTWLLRWRIDTLKGTISEPFADYWQRLHERFVADCAFSERYKVASPAEQAALLAEKIRIGK